MINEIAIRQYSREAVAPVANLLVESGDWKLFAHTEDCQTTLGLIHDALIELAPSNLACRKIVYKYIDGSLPMFSFEVIALLKTMVIFPSISPLSH